MAIEYFFWTSSSGTCAIGLEGKQGNMEMAQKVLLKRAYLNHLAMRAEYLSVLEKDRIVSFKLTIMW